LNLIARGTALQATKNDIQTNTTKYGGDLLSKVETQFECCENFGVSKNVSHLELELNFKHMVSCVEDLKYASYKVSKLEEKIKETEWKHQHTKSHSTYSVFVYILITLVSMYVSYRLGRLVVSQWTQNKTVRAILGQTENVELSTKSSGAGNIVNISIKTSNESLSGSPEAVPLKDLDSSSTKASTPELRRSRRIRATKSYF
jgi:hypothetical protein